MKLTLKKLSKAHKDIYGTPITKAVIQKYIECALEYVTNPQAKGKMPVDDISSFHGQSVDRLSTGFCFYARLVLPSLIDDDSPTAYSIWSTLSQFEDSVAYSWERRKDRQSGRTPERIMMVAQLAAELELMLQNSQ